LEGKHPDVTPPWHCLVQFVTCTFAEKHAPEGNMSDRRGMTYGAKKWEALGVDASEKLLSAVLDGIFERSKVIGLVAHLTHTLFHRDPTRFHKEFLKAANSGTGGQLGSESSAQSQPRETF
jgi:hypothetical protein